MENTNNQKNILILFFTLIVVMLGFGIVIPILPFYVKSFGASGSALGALMAVYGILQFIFAPLWGSLSDRIGRKPVLMIGVLGNAIAQLLFGLSTHLWMLFAARALAGMLSVATLPTAMAYISDSTTQKNRSSGMGMVGAAMGIGMVLGPGMGGLLAKLSLSFPFFLASALSLAALVLIFIFLPEAPRTLEEQTETKNEPRLQAMLQALKGPLGVLFLMSFLLSFAITNFESIFGLYASDRYSYSPGQVGLILTVVGVLSAFMQGVMTGPATRRFGDAAVVRASLAGTAIGFLLMTQARTFPQVMLTVGIFIVSNALLNPSVASMISKRTDNAQGMTMGLNNSFLSLGRIAGPLWAGFVYDINLNAPYLSGATIMLVGFGVSLLALQAISYRSVPAETNLQDL
jgi:MFS transporter, DHA1 family, multidrug resistance protein